jgi:hypothetical protein
MSKGMSEISVRLQTASIHSINIHSIRLVGDELYCADRQTDRRADGQIDIQTDRQTDRQTDTQTDRQTGGRT